MKRPILILSILLSSLIVFAAAQEKGGHKTEPRKIDQHWKVVADVAPADLERQLKILNEAGITVSTDDLKLVGDKFTIIICDESEE